MRNLFKGILAIIIAALMIGTCLVSLDIGYTTGAQNGYGQAMTDVQSLLAQSGIEYQCHQLSNGSYSLTIMGVDNNQNATAEHFILTCDLTVKAYSPTGQLLSSGHHTGTFTTWGQQWAAYELSNPTYSTAGLVAQYISMSLTSSGLTSASTILPSEITADGLARTAGTFTSTGTGTWTVAYTFTDSTAPQSPLVWGISAGTAASTTGYGGNTITAGNNLIWYDPGPGTQTLTVGATLAVTATMSIS